MRFQLLRQEGHLGIPLPAATQWEIVSEAAAILEPVGEELIRQAAQGSLLHNDDTSIKILDYEREPSDTRTGLFTRAPGAPLDNNICERALKMAILHPKNAWFYRTVNGARVGDLFMSLIHTAELGGANPFDYLTELLRHPKELKQAPARWMPWNYRENLAQATKAAA